MTERLQMSAKDQKITAQQTNRNFIYTIKYQLHEFGVRYRTIVNCVR